MNQEPVMRNVTAYDLLPQLNFNNVTANSTSDNATIETNSTATNTNQVIDDSKWQDNSIDPLIADLPTSYSLITPQDFRTVQRNYTYDWLYGQQIHKRDPNSPSFNLFEFFDDDLFHMRDIEGSQWYNGGGYLIYEANLTSNKYRVINYVNTTSQDIAAAWP